MSDATTITILYARRVEAESRLKKLAAKAEKYGNEPISWSFGKPYQGVYEDRDGKFKVDYVDLVVTGGAVRVGNHRFLAKIEHTSAGNIVDTPPETEGRPEWRDLAPNCDHCGHDRLRKETFIVAEPGGEVVQVGRTCLRDYLGTDKPETVISATRWMREFREEVESFYGFGSSISTYSTVLAAVVATRLFGFVPKSAPEDAGAPTAFWVEDVVGHSTSKSARAARAQFRDALSDADHARADEVLAFIRAGRGSESDYRHNMAIAAGDDIIDPKRIGIVASAPAALEREEGKIAERKAREDEARKRSAGIVHLGQVGKRRVFEGEVVFEKTIDGFYGASNMVKVHTADSGMVVMFTTAEDAWDLKAGDVVKMRATIADHTEFNGTKETKVKRP